MSTLKFKKKNIINKMIKKQIFITISTAFLLIFILVGSSYAILNGKTETGVSDVVVQSGNLIASIKTEEEEIIEMNYTTLGVSNEVGLTYDPYTFSVENTGETTIAYYELRIVDKEHEVSTLPHKSINYALSVNDDEYTSPQNLGDNYSYIYTGDSLEPGESDDFSLKMWVNEEFGHYANNKVLKASIEITLYSDVPTRNYIIYDTQGGSYVLKTNINSKRISNQVPKKTGFTFEGWSNEVNGEVLYNNNDLYLSNNGTILYAIWSRSEQIYNVTYNGNRFTTLESQELYGVTITYDPDTSYVTLNGSPTTSLTLVHLPEEFVDGDQYKTTISYVSGSFEKVGKTTFTTEVADSAKENLSTRNFVDGTWPTSDVDSNPTVLTIDELSETQGEYLRVYMWFEDPSSVTFNNYTIKVNLTKNDVKTVVYDGTYETLGETPVRPGYTFSGWYTQEDGGTQITSSSKVNLTSNHTLYAHWQPSVYTVAYNGNRFVTLESQELYGVTITYDPNTSYLTLNGSPTTSLTLVHLPEEIISGNQYETTISYVSGSFEKEGSATFTTEVNDADKKTLDTRNYVNAMWPTSDDPQNSSILTVTDYSETVGEYIRVFMWFEDPSLVTFDNYTIKVNLTKVDKKEVTYNSTYQTLGEIPLRPGYRFLGWYTEEAGGTEITEETKVTTTDNHTLYAHWIEATKPVCIFSGPATASVKVGSKSTYTLTCTDSSGFDDSEITASDFTQSTSGVLTISAPTKETVTDGYKYTISVTGKKAGSTTITLNEGAISDASGNTNDAITSSSITIQALTCSWKTSSSTTVTGTCSGTSKPSNPTSGSTYTTCSNTKWRYSMGSGTCANGKTYSSSTSGYTYTSSSAASSGCTSKRASSCSGSYSQSGGSCSTGSSSTKTTYKYTCS